MVILGIDQARSSGYGIVRAETHSVLEVGVAKTPADRAVVVAHALRHAGDGPLRVVFEDHSSVPARGGRDARTLLGIGAARGRWEERLALAGVPAAHYAHRVTPEKWRGDVLGLGRGVRAEYAKAKAVEYARALLGAELEHDAAEGLCLSVWGARTIPAMLERARVLAAAARKARS